MRYTKRDECGNAHLIHGQQDEHTARAFLNHVATMEDWYDAYLKDGSISVIRCENCEHLLTWEDNDEQKLYCPMIDMIVGEGFYCAYGERKHDESNT